MNETNSLETQLKSWALRRPSAKFEGRLFAPAPTERHPTVAFAWLAPAAACLFLAVSMLHRPEGEMFAGSSTTNNWGSLTFNNHSSIRYSSSNYQGTENPSATFEWTNGGTSTSSNPPLTPGRTDKQEALWKK